MSLSDAASTLVRELDSLAQWEGELRRNLELTSRRRADLNRALDSLIPSLGADDRRKYREMIARIEMPWPRHSRRPSVMTPRVLAVHDYLADAEDTVQVRDLQQHLQDLGLSNSNGDAHTILARKVDQGMVERLGRGTYRVNPRHREIVNRRRKQA